VNRPGPLMSIVLYGILLSLAPAALNAQPRTVTFSGYDWVVKDSRQRKLAPGPNYYSPSESSVRVGPSGHLHLAIRKEEDRWYCAEVFTRQRFGYGLYSIRLSGLLATLDPVMVLGLFTYDTADPPLYQELDIEFSRWGKPESPWLHYTVQPYQERGRSHPASPDITTTDSLHTFLWSPGEVLFSSYAVPGEGTEPVLVHQWRLEAPDIPLPRRPAFRINFWLFQGLIPEEGAEVVIKEFSFTPAR